MDVLLRTIIVAAPAKVNLTLDVTEKRADGYHTVCSVMQSISLCDRLTLTPHESIRLTCSDANLSCGEDNLAVRAARLFFAQTGLHGGVTIDLEKKIPMQAGLGGGSSDAAAVLFGLNELYAAGLSTGQLCEMGAALGADVPFALAGGTKRAEGIGTKLHDAPALHSSLCFVVVKPQAGSATQGAYAALDACAQLDHPDTEAMLRALEKNDSAAVAAALGNVFEQVCDAQTLQNYKARFARSGALSSLLCGSGSAVFGLFDDEEKALDCCMELIAEGEQAFLAEPLSCGPWILKTLE